jgi:hypothetical protein
MQKFEATIYTLGEVVDRLKSGQYAMCVKKNTFGLGTLIYIKDGVLCYWKNDLPIQVPVPSSPEHTWVII